MKTLQRFLMALGMVLLLAVSLQLFIPKAVHAVVSTLVTIANTSANPVPVDTSADGRGSIALLSSQQLNAPTTSGRQAFVNVTDFSAFVIPSGKRFMIDQLNAFVQSEPGGQPLLVMEMTEGNGHPFLFYIPLTVTPATTTDNQLNLNEYAAMSKVSLFVDPGGPFDVFFESQTPNSVSLAGVNVFGHFIDCGSGCAGQ